LNLVIFPLTLKLYNGYIAFTTAITFMDLKKFLSYCCNLCTVALAKILGCS